MNTKSSELTKYRNELIELNKSIYHKRHELAELEKRAKDILTKIEEIESNGWDAAYIKGKEMYPDAVILFRVGDFYKAYKEDARLVSEVCGIVLNDNNTTGFPHYSLDMYLPKLIRAGKRIAICDL